MSTLVSVSHHTLRQLKFIVPGGLFTYWLDSHHALWQLANSESGWARSSAIGSLGLAFVTFSLFMYVLLVPIIKGEQPNYRHWRQSGVLSSVIPALTAAIVSGWTLLFYTLAYWADLGLIKGVVAASGLYAFGFGLMGLIPAPKVTRS